MLFNAGEGNFMAYMDGDVSGIPSKSFYVRNHGCSGKESCYRGWMEVEDFLALPTILHHAPDGSPLCWIARIGFKCDS